MLPANSHNQASKMILDYMMAQNRPYAVTDIITNLHGIVGKTLAIKVLAGLAEEGSLLAKTYGKSIIYVVKQVSLFDSPSINAANISIDARRPQRGRNRYRRAKRRRNYKRSSREGNCTKRRVQGFERW